MGNDPVNPRGGNQPAFDADLHPLVDPSRSLVEDLGGIVDDIRQIATDLGARPYRVFSVTYRWTGGEIGRGTPEVVSETEFLPTPLVSMKPITQFVTSGGVIERGGTTLEELSPRYTEDQIQALCHGDRTCSGPGFQTFIEVTQDRRDGASPRRRFTTDSAPVRDPDDFEWSVRIQKQDGDRSRSGEPSRVGMRDPFSGPRR